MDNLTTEQRMRAHVIITLIVLWAISEHYGAGFSIATLTLGALNIQSVVPNWVIFLALGLGIFWLRRHRDAVLGPIESWMRWVLLGEGEQPAVTGATERIEYIEQVDRY